MIADATPIAANATYTIVFYVLAAIAVALALVVVNARRLLRAAVCLMGVLAASAALYVMLSAAFLAGVQVLVYVGGIVVLIVFAVMLTSANDLLEDRPSVKRMLLGALVSNIFMVLTVVTLVVTPFAARAADPAPKDLVRTIGLGLLDTGSDGYVLAFEVISLLLLAAIIGGIVIARKKAPPGQADDQVEATQQEAQQS